MQMKTTNRGVLNCIAVVIVIGALLPQVGCVDAAEDGEPGRAPPEAAATQALASWTVPYISVLQPSGTIGPKVMDIRDGSFSQGALAQLWQRNGEIQQEWKVVPAGTQSGKTFYELRSGLTGMCLDMAIDGAVGNGTRVQQWPCTGASNQRWIAEHSSGWVRLFNQQTPGLCLDVTGARYVDGVPLQVWECNTGWNQRWNIFP